MHLCFCQVWIYYSHHRWDVGCSLTMACVAGAIVDYKTTSIQGRHEFAYLIYCWAFPHLTCLEGALLSPPHSNFPHINKPCCSRNDWGLPLSFLLEFSRHLEKSHTQTSDTLAIHSFSINVSHHGFDVGLSTLPAFKWTVCQVIAKYKHMEWRELTGWILWHSPETFWLINTATLYPVFIGYIC